MSEWKECRLGDVCTKIGSGATPSGGKEAYKGGAFALIRSQNVIDFEFSKRGLAYINDSQAHKLDNVAVESDDILFNITGDSVARCCIVDDTVLPARVNQHVAIIRLNKELAYPRYILSLLINKKPELTCLASFGATRNAITKKMLENLCIKLPPLSEQKKIAAILSSLDEKIETNRKINARLEELAQALFKSWFIDNAIYEGDSIADYFLPNRGKVLLTSDAEFGEVPVVAGGLQPAAYHNKANTQSPVITISASGANAGYVNIWGCPVWSSDSSFIDNSLTPYIYFWFNLLKHYQKNIYHSQTGCAQPHIYPKHIGELRIPRFDFTKVKKYEEIIAPLYNRFFVTNKESARLAALRDTLLPKLMSGELIPE